LGPHPEARSLGVLIRALLSAIALVVLIPVGFAVIGGYFPHLPVVGPFGAVLNTGLPWVLAAAALGTGLAGASVALGGRKVRALLLAALVLLLGAGFVVYRYATFATEQGAGYDVIRAADGFPPVPDADTELVFATVDGVDLHAGLWLPASEPRSRPAVVFVHGGGFFGGGLGTRPMLLGALRKAGIIGVDVEYRLSPPPRWDQAPADVLCALAWLATAPELATVDRSRVVIAGESAGGSLALIAGYAAGTDELTSSCPGLGAPVVPAAVFAIDPTADLEGIWRDRTIHDFQGGVFPEAYIGGAPDQYPDRYAAAEPFRLLRPDLPPTVILAGEIDKFVFIERQIALANRIRGAGAPVELLIAPFAGHGFDGEPNSFGDQLTEPVLSALVLRVPGTTAGLKP
jgi:acetyl esterase/lipase